MEGAEKGYNSGVKEGSNHIANVKLAECNEAKLIYTYTALYAYGAI